MDIRRPSPATLLALAGLLSTLLLTGAAAGSVGRTVAPDHSPEYGDGGDVAADLEPGLRERQRRASGIAPISRQAVDACGSGTESDPTFDAVTLDIDVADAFSDCAVVVFAMSTRDDWTDDQLDFARFNVDTDGTPDTGCAGFNLAVFPEPNGDGTWTGRLFATGTSTDTEANCDQATWTELPSVAAGRTTTDDLVIAIPMTLFGDPTVAWAGVLASIDTSFDVAPDLGAYLWQLTLPDLPTCFGRTATIVATPGFVTAGTAGPDVIVGTNGRDDIRGNGGADLICALGGDDSVRGGGGDDRIDLGAGNDGADGQGGRDRIIGGPGADDIAGSAGADTLVGGSGGDSLFGGGGNDRIDGNGGNDVLSGARGNDRMNGGAGRDECSPGPGRNALRSCERRG